jgi:putative ABC transport system permease protein
MNFRLIWRETMFKNYLKITFRNLRKNRTYSLINISGLAIGMACTILILLWVNYELSYDGFHKNYKEIYWTVRKYANPDGSTDFSLVTVLPMADVLKSEFPEILKAARFNDAFGEFPLKFKDKTIFTKGSPTDPDFFDIFTFPFKYGDAATALGNSHSIVITNRMAQKFFGENTPVGQTLQFELWGQWWDFMVTGVIEDIPANSHFDFDLLFSTTFLVSRGWDETNWLNGCVKTYIQTAPGTDAAALNKKIADINMRHHPQATASIYLHPLKKIHLYDLDGGGRIIYIYIFTTIAFFILVISCINFINLSTACSEKRAKEVGVRKVVGAFRRQLASQFLIESIVFSLLSLAIALLIVQISIPFLNRITGTEFALDYTGSMVLWFVGIALFAGVVSGFYPALIMSSATTIHMFKGGRAGKGLHNLPSLRKILVGFQFMLSIILIIAVMSIHKQLSFMKNKDLGFDRLHVVRLTLRSELRDQRKFETIKNELLRNPDILATTTCNSNFTNWQYTIDENDVSWPGKQPQDKIEMEVNSVDFDYLKTFDMKMAQGRFFSQDFTTDANEAVILNETAVKVLGLQNPMGQHIQYRGNRQIVGIIKDFNFYSLHEQIQPMVLIVAPFWYHSFYIKIRGTKPMDTIQFLERTIKQVVPDYPFVYNFLDDNLNQLYKTELNAGKILMIFSFLAVFISCLGIFGLIAYVAERRTKEIGIRKTLGASVIRVVVLLTGDFTKWILIANIIAWPVAWFAMNKWLHNFAYRTHMSWWIFAVSGGMALLIALLTISWQAVRAATANPVKTLRYE